MTGSMERRTFLTAIGAGVAGLTSSASTAAGTRNDGVVNATAKLVEEQYIDPRVAGQLGSLLRANLRAGKYGRLSRNGLAARLTEDLRSINHDLHLDVSSEAPPIDEETAEKLPEDKLHPRTTNFGVQTVARLQGDIGLLRITHFPSPPYYFDNHYAAAMELLRYTKALILDLRINHGGGEDTTGYFLSYFINGNMDFGKTISRNGDVEVIKTEPNISGKPYGEDRPIYVLISSNTFSAGEAVADHLRRFRRSNPATLVGQRTRGGAHRGQFFKLPDDFRIFIPTSRSIGPDWKGVGVSPDVLSPPEEALEVAHRLAIEKLITTTTDRDNKQILENVLANRIENLSSFGRK